MVPHALAAGQRLAERLMTDACLIRRRTGEYTDPSTGVITPTYATVYEGKCRVQQQTTQATEAKPGGAHLLILRLELQVPIAVTGVEVADEVKVTASLADPDLTGRTLYVRDLAHKSQATSRRFQVMERTS